MPSDHIYTAGVGVLVVQNTGASLFSSFAGAFTLEATEAFTQVQARAAYTWTNLGARVRTNGLSSGTTNVFARLNGADETALQLDIAAFQTGWFEDLTGSVSVADGDLLNYRHDAAGMHGETISWTMAASELQHATLERPIVVSNSEDVRYSVDQGTTEFVCVAGCLGDGTATESEVEYILRQGVTFSNLRCHVESNDTDNASTFELREDGVSSTNLTISIPANTTGSFEDTDSEAVSTGSTVNYRVVAGAGVGGDTLVIAMTQMLQAGAVTARNLAASHTVGQAVTGSRHAPVEGDLSTLSPTVTFVQAKAQVAVPLRDMFLRVRLNDLATASTNVQFRINQVPTALEIVVPSGSTGVFEDSDTVSLAPGELYNWSIGVLADGGGSITLAILGLEQGQAGVEQPFEEDPHGIFRVVTARAY